MVGILFVNFRPSNLGLFGFPLQSSNTSAKKKKKRKRKRKVGVVVLLASREWKAGSAGNQNKKKIGKIMKHRWRKGLP
jgi:hypothetical protein